MILDKIENPKDLKKLNIKEKEILSKEIREEIIDALRGYHVMDNPTSDFALNYIKQIFWPRQIIQLYGKDFFNKYFNRLEQDFNENYIYDKSWNIYPYSTLQKE